MSFYGWTKGEELNLKRLYKTRKLLLLCKESGHLIDVVVRANPAICVRGCIELLNLAISTEEAEKNKGISCK